MPNIKNEKMNIKLDKNLGDQLSLDLPIETTLKVDSDNIIINTNQNTINIKTISFILPALITSLAFILSIISFNKTQVPLYGDVSIATGVFVFGIISGMSCFIYYFIKERSKSSNAKDIYWRNFPTIVISFAAILFLILLLLFAVIDKLFVGASFDIYTSTFLVLIFTSIINYIMISLAQSITPRLLTNVLICVIIGGVIAAMITNREIQWWKYNFSFLGTEKANRSWEFNITLIFSGLLMIALVDYLFVLLKRNIDTPKKLLALKILLILTALSLAGVGLFPYNDSPFYRLMHNKMAGYLVYLIIIIIFSLKFLLPSIGKDFMRLSYLVVILLLISIYLFLGIGYLSLTAFELIAFLIAFSWLLLLIKNLQQLAYNTNQSYPITLSIDEIV